ncbi:hypothetical protein HRbin39_01564 [bacterium HR39]|nr:hypothetical protein HRbin39_01564 [bacterium HR39]
MGEAHLGTLPQPHARTEADGRLGGRHAAGLDVAGDADAAELALRLRLPAALLEVGVVGELQRPVETGLVVAGVVDQRHRRLVGEGVLRDEVAPADLGAVDAELARRRVHQRLHQIARLGPSGAAIRIHRRGVGVVRLHVAVDGRDAVLTREQRRVEICRNRRAEAAHVGAEIGLGGHAHGEEAAVPVHRQLGMRDVVAPVGVGEEGLAALLAPLDGPAHLPRRPGDEAFLTVDEDLGAEAAAHVGGDHPQLVLRRDAHEGGHHQPVQVRVLAGEIAGVLVLAGVVDADGRARLEGVGHEPVVDEIHRDHPIGLREGLVHRGAVADLPVVAQVVGDVVVHQRRGVVGRVEVHHRRQLLVLHHQRLGRIARLVQRLGDDHRHPVAHVAHLVRGEQAVGAHLHGAAVARVDHPPADQRPEPRLLDVLAGEHRQHPGHADDRGSVDAPDAGVGVRRAHEDGMGLAGQVDVVGVPATAGDEPPVLLARDRLADALLHHDRSLPLLVSGLTRPPAASSASPRRRRGWP